MLWEQGELILGAFFYVQDSEILWIAALRSIVTGGRILLCSYYGATTCALARCRQRQRDLSEWETNSSKKPWI